MKIRLLAMLVAGASVLPAAAFAQSNSNQSAGGTNAQVAGGTTNPVPKTAAVETAEVKLGGEVVMRLRGSLGGYTAKQRADQVTERLTPILSLPNLQPEDIQARQIKGTTDTAIYVRDRLLVTIGWQNARANNTTPALLAQQYVTTLRRVLPQVAPSMEDSPFTPPAAQGGGATGAESGATP